MQREKLINQLTDEIFKRLYPGQEGVACRTLSIEESADQFKLLISCGAERFGTRAGESCQGNGLAKYIDHTLLKPTATAKDIEKLCGEALEFGFASVCVNPCYVSLAARLLKGSCVAACTVAGFPLGASAGDVKSLEARRAIFDGAGEIDMVINIGALKSGDDDLVLNDIRGVAQACRENGSLCKVIIEAAYLNDEEKVKACVLAKEAGAHFVKTSTGFGPGGATLEDVALMRRTVGSGLGVKAAGGIKDAGDTEQMIKAGASRIGASAGVMIVQGESAGSDGY